MPSSEDISGRSFLGDLAMTLSRHDEIDIRPARALADYWFLRSLRNRVRRHMTNNTTSIDCVQQLRFYMRKPRNIDIYIARLDAKRVGYLLLRHEGSTTLITEAVDESYRRIGIARRLVQHAQQMHADLTAEILVSNVASIRLHEAAGFTFASSHGDVQTFRFARLKEVSCPYPAGRTTRSSR